MMENSDTKRQAVKTIARAGRRAAKLTEQELVKIAPLSDHSPLPLLVQAMVAGVGLTAWAARNRDLIESNLLKHAALLFRGFEIKGAAEFEQFIRTLSGELLEYSYGSTPRTHVSGGIYTSTEYPANQAIPLHNEMAYSTAWPMKLWFYCEEPAEEGGETPIASSLRVYERIPPAIREKFIKKKVMYVRSYGEGLDIPWQKVFHTSNSAEVEEYCRQNGIGFHWKDRQRLKTWQVCQAVASHPKTGDEVWFNQAHLFHASSLDPHLLDTLLEKFGEEDLPRTAIYGDGSPIENDVLDQIREAYRQQAILFSWERGDVLMLDNMLAAHGRNPYKGYRRVLVGMAEAMRCDQMEAR